MARKRKLSDKEYRRLLEFRTGLRKFLYWTEVQASKQGLTPTQHQLLLAIKGHDDGRPSIRDIADSLVLRHHSAVELVDRAEAAGLVRRVPDPQDGRRVRLRLTAIGERKLEAVTIPSLEQLDKIGPQLRNFWGDLADPRQESQERE